ncbi:nucleotide-binding alpha-beta plait domain-containing protein [Tanacetum coccineum]
MGSHRSKEDEILKISTFVFVTNFPEQFKAKDLWNTCKQYGYVVDAFIPNRRAKDGKRFGFVRFIKVLDVDSLVSNLCTVWVGLYKIHANVARYKPINVELESIPALVLDDTCLNHEGFDQVIIRYMGGHWIMLEFLSVEVKKKFESSVGIGSWFSQIQQALVDFTVDGRIVWVELKGIPLKMWLENTFKRIASKWGTLLHMDDQEEKCIYMKRICINMTVPQIF